MAYDHNAPWKLALTLLCGAAISSLSASSPTPTEMDRLQFYIGEWADAATYDKSTLFPTGGRNAGWWTSQWATAACPW